MYQPHLKKLKWLSKVKLGHNNKKKKMTLKKFIFIMFCLLFGVGISVGIVMILFFAIDPYQYSHKTIWGIEGVYDVFWLLFLLVFMLSSSFLTLQLTLWITKAFTSKFPNQIQTTKLEINNEWLNKDQTLGSAFNEANERYLLVRIRDRKFYIYSCLAGAILFAYFAADSFDNNSILGDGVGYVTFAIAFAICFFISLLYPTSIIIFDRMNGTVTFPKMLFVRNRTVPFSDVIIGDRKLMCVKHPSRATFYYIPGLLSEGYFTSFYVWYMDKNRPLPSGSLFDPYREIDFKRRQSEGFPDPIYPSRELITDDRAGYIYGDEKALKIISSSRVKVSVAYDVVITALYKQYPEIKEEEVVLIGVWQDYYVFSANASLNQPLKLFVECPPNAFLVHKDKKKVKLYAY